MNYNTRKLLRLLRCVGYTKVTIGDIYEKGFPKPVYKTGVSCLPDIKYDGKYIDENGNPFQWKHTWPALWYILNKLPEVNFGCGHGQSHQVRHQSLTDGVYDLTTLKF